MAGEGPGEAEVNAHLIETERLLLSVPDPNDAPTLYDLVGGEHRAEITADLVWDGPDDISEIKHFIEHARTGIYGDDGFHWAIRDKEGRFTEAPGRALGMIATRPRGEPGRGDVGYWLGRPYWGQGIMREALVGLLDLCFGELDLVKIEAEIFTGNTRSMRLVESLGMRLEGTIRWAHRKRGRWVDVHVFGMLVDEWPDLRPS